MVEEGEAPLAVPAWFALHHQHRLHGTWQLVSFEQGLDQMSPWDPVLLLDY